MIISRTPYRLSFFGGGTDYPCWYREHGGAVLTTTINRYCYLAARRVPAFFGKRYRVLWAKAEAVDRIEDIEHASVRGCLQYLGFDDAMEVNHAGDLPARSGVGSSSAFTVGMLHVLHALRCETKSQAQLAREAIEVEQVVLRETVGVQDQIQCAHGGFNVVKIGRDGSYTVNPVPLVPTKLAELESHLVLLFTGTQRDASEIAQAQVTNASRHRDELQAIQDLVRLGVNLLLEGTMKQFGELLHEAWMLKRELSPLVTNDGIDSAYNEARRLGAYGGKLVGAGGGGFMLLLAPPDKQAEIEARLGFVRDYVRLENTGSQIVYRSA